MKTALAFFLFLFFFILDSSGQNEKIKFGKIAPADLAMKVYSPDPEADAVVLSKIGRVTYDIMAEKYQLTEETHVVIKILKEPAIDKYGNVKLNYNSYNNYSKVGSVKALVHLPDGTEIKVDNSQIFDDKVNEYWSSKKIAFPRLVPGAIIEYQYITISDQMFHPVDWFFQDEIPIRYTELTTKIPELFEYVVLTQGTPLDKVDKTTTTEPLTISGVSRGETATDRSRFYRGTGDIIYIHHTYINENVPALRKECCITTMEDYYSRVRFRLNAIKHHDGSRKPIMSTWKEVANGLYLDQIFGAQLKNSKPGELVLEAAGIMLSDTFTKLEIAQRLYDYLNSNIQWNGFYGFGSKEINTLLREKSGSSGDLNKLMAAGLLRSGIDAKPVFISTRDNGKLLELYPFVDQFNHMVVFAKIDGKDTWIDVGDKNLPFGMLRKEALNARGWVADEEEPYWIDIKSPDSKTVFLVKGTLDADGNLNGDMESRFTGYHALSHRERVVEEKDKYPDNLVVRTQMPFKVSETTMINKDAVGLPFQLKAKIIDQPVATVASDKIYLSTILPVGLDEMPFKLEERTYPIEMNYPEEISMIMDIGLPEGYTVESLPAPVRFVTENNGLQVIYNATQTAGRLNITFKYVIRQLQYSPDDYAALKNLYNQRYQKFNEQIVLTKT